MKRRRGALSIVATPAYVPKGGCVRCGKKKGRDFRCGLCDKCAFGRGGRR